MDAETVKERIDTSDDFLFTLTFAENKFLKERCPRLTPSKHHLIQNKSRNYHPYKKFTLCGIVIRISLVPGCVFFFFFCEGITEELKLETFPCAARRLACHLRKNLVNGNPDSNAQRKRIPLITK